MFDIFIPALTCYALEYYFVIKFPVSDGLIYSENITGNVFKTLKMHIENIASSKLGFMLINWFIHL